jgi:sialic acid synthase SpsE
MKIGTRQIGPDQSPYIIAELGVNHDGSLEKALALTDAAAQVGVDAIKLQLFEADLLMSKASKLAAYQQAAGESDPITMLRRLQLPLSDMRTVIDRAHSLNLHAIVTVFSLELVDAAWELPWDAYKSASPDITNRPLLEALAGLSGPAREPRPLIISTGASTLQEVARALSWLHDIRDRLAVLQCVSSYPTPDNMAELGGIAAIRDIFPGAVGYSDHTAQTLTAALAVALGSSILEKHLTYDKKAQGPDHAASLTPDMMAEYVGFARRAHSARQHLLEVHPHEDFLRFVGAAEKISSPGVVFERVKRVLPAEEDVRHVSRQSLTTTRPLEAGHLINRSDLTVKRPGTGIPPYKLPEVLGRATSRAVEGDMPLMEEDLS